MASSIQIGVQSNPLRAFMSSRMQGEPDRSRCSFTYAAAAARSSWRPRRSQPDLPGSRQALDSRPARFQASRGLKAANVASLFDMKALNLEHSEHGKDCERRHHR